jgi:ribosomal protein S18 acetylase RimI-like enzyme
MRKPDLPALLTVADIVHPAYPEDPAVFVERLELYPEGCLVLEQGGKAMGYVVSHPGTYGAPPRLNSLLGALPAKPTTYYIHDIALLPEMRGTGAASMVVGQLVEHAVRHGFPGITLTAVNDSRDFWERRGFHAVDVAGLAESLSSYDHAAIFMARDCPRAATQPIRSEAPGPERTG